MPESTDRDTVHEQANALNTGRDASIQAGRQLAGLDTDSRQGSQQEDK